MKEKVALTVYLVPCLCQSVWCLLSVWYRLSVPESVPSVPVYEVSALLLLTLSV